MKINPPFDETGIEYQHTRMSHWDRVAQKRDHWRGLGHWYHRRLNEIYQFLVNSDQRILEIGCGTGDLLAALKPAHASGVDFSSEMIERARRKNPTLEFHQL